MEKDQLLRWAVKAGAWPEMSTTPEKDIAFLERFAALVAAHQSEQAKPEEFTEEALQTIIDAISSQPPTLMKVAVAVQAFRDDKWRQAIKGRP